MANSKTVDIVNSLWIDMDAQSWDELRKYFDKNAVINWHNTNEQFTVDEFILANSAYPGDWDIDIEKIFDINDIVISVVRVSLSGGNMHFHANSIFKFENDLIKQLDEYWGDDGDAPQWRQDMKIGKPIL